MRKPLFDNFRSTFANTWPIHITNDTTDLSQVKDYDSKFVWLKHVDATIDPKFDYTWRPAPELSHNVFDFPICDKTLRPYNWDSMRLVPTQLGNNISIIKMNIPAGVYDYEHSVLVLGSSRDNMKPYIRRFCNAMYLGHPSTAERMASRIRLLNHTLHSLVLYDHVEMNEIHFNEKLDPNTLYLFKAKNLLTRFTSTSACAMLVPDEIHEVKVMDYEVESNVRTATPDIMWKRGFLDAHVIKAVNEDSTKITKRKLDSGPARFYMKGFQAALDNPQEFDIKMPWFGADILDELYQKLK